MSMSKYVTLSSSVPIYNKLLDHIENLLNEEDEKYCKILNIRNAIQKGYEKLKVIILRQMIHTHTPLQQVISLFFLSLIFNL